MEYGERFDAMLAMLQRKQDAYVRRVWHSIDGVGGIELERVRRHHDGLADRLARNLLEVATDSPDEERASELYGRIIEATCLPLRSNERQIQDAVNGAWEMVIGLDDVDHISRVTRGGTAVGIWKMLEHTLETLKAWILVSEASLARLPVAFDVQAASRQLGHMSARMAEKHYRRQSKGTGAGEGAG